MSAHQLLALGALGAGAALAADHAVSIAGSAFSPPSLTVTVGETVTWTNSDDIPHTATADGGSFDTRASPSRSRTCRAAPVSMKSQQPPSSLWRVPARTGHRPE